MIQELSRLLNDLAIPHRTRPAYRAGIARTRLAALPAMVFVTSTRKRYCPVQLLF
jgi:hypothetical protein